MLGELHHLFPNFQAGMGFGDKYLVSDYSPASVEGFRAFLAAEQPAYVVMAAARVGGTATARAVSWTSDSTLRRPG